MSSLSIDPKEKEISHIEIDSSPKKNLYEITGKEGFSTPKAHVTNKFITTSYDSQKPFFSGFSGNIIANLFPKKSDVILGGGDLLFNNTEEDNSLKFPINSSEEKSTHKKNFNFNFFFEKPPKITKCDIKKGVNLIGNYAYTLGDDFFKSIEECLSENKSKLLENPWLSTNNLSIREIDEDNTYHNYCICGKSNCSNVYCSCRKGGKICGELCKCIGCKNKSITKLYRWQRKHKMSEKTIICKCKSTECHSGYCDCFKSGKICGEECGCINCKNKEKTPILENNNNNINNL